VKLLWKSEQNGGDITRKLHAWTMDNNENDYRRTALAAVRGEYPPGD